MEKTVPQDNNWPFSPHDGERHSDIAVANIISSALANGRAESHLIWQRYSAMLIANGIFLGFLLRNFHGMLVLMSFLLEAQKME